MINAPLNVERTIEIKRKIKETYVEAHKQKLNKQLEYEAQELIAIQKRQQARFLIPQEFTYEKVLRLNKIQDLIKKKVLKCKRIVYKKYKQTDNTATQLIDEIPNELGSNDGGNSDLETFTESSITDSEERLGKTILNLDEGSEIESITTISEDFETDSDDDSENESEQTTDNETCSNSSGSDTSISQSSYTEQKQINNHKISQRPNILSFEQAFYAHDLIQDVSADKCLKRLHDLCNEIYIIG